MEAKRLEELFRKQGIPHLPIESDYESPAPAALTTRIEAFLDLLRH
jgi:benzoyl-CoA reductase/2-hydroxyglutaryl-CoA dehydratase subunit BcrC/BadD/HgdB